MGNCLDATPYPARQGKAPRSKGAYSRSAAPSFGGSTHSLLRTGAYPPYGLSGHVIPAYSAPSIPSYYQPVHPSFYHPMQMHYADDFWANGFKSESFDDLGHYKRRRNYVTNLTNEDSPRRKDKVQRNNLNSVIITTSLNPKDDVIKGGSHIVMPTTKAPLVQSGVMSNKQTVVTSTIPAPTSKNKKVDHPDDKFDTVPKRGSTYITYIEDDPTPSASIGEATEPPDMPEVKIAELKETVEGNHKLFELFIDEALAASEPRPVSHTLEDILSSYGTAPPQFVPCDVVVCYGSHEATAIKIKKSLQSAGVNVWLSKCSPQSSPREAITAAHAIIEAKVLIVLLSLDSIKLRTLRDQVSLAHISETSVFPATLDQSLDIITSMDMCLKLQLSSYKWTELVNGYSELNLFHLVRSIRDEINIIRGFEIIDEDYGQVSSKAPRRLKSIRQQLLTRSVDLTTHITAGSYWLDHYQDETEIPWDRFLRDIRSSYHELLTCSVPKSSNKHFNEALKRELVDPTNGMVHKSIFLEFCKDLATDRDVWEKLHTVARETQAILEVFSAESSVRPAALNKLGKLINPYMADVVRESIKDKDSSVRAVTVVALSQYALPDDHVTQNTILAALGDADSLVREAACVAAANLKSKQALEKLQSLALDYRLWGIPKKQIERLQKMQDKAARIVTLIERHDDSSIQVRDAAAKAIREIG